MDAATREFVRRRARDRCEDCLIRREYALACSTFHPRKDAWADHSALRGPTIVGLTPTGRATAQVLAMNAIRQERRRAFLLAEGRSWRGSVWGRASRGGGADSENAGAVISDDEGCSLAIRSRVGPRPGNPGPHRPAHW